MDIWENLRLEYFMNDIVSILVKISAPSVNTENSNPASL